MSYLPINYKEVFASIPKYLGLYMNYRYGSWVGPYYLDGTPCRKRDDKLKVFMGRRGVVYVTEQGGQTLTLWDWLLTYGGLNGNEQVYKRLSGESLFDEFKESVDVEFTSTEGAPTKYVKWGAMIETTRGGVYEDNLYKLLCKKFGIRVTKRAYSRYFIGNKNRGELGWATVFWVIDRAGRVLNDTWIVYGEDGHRGRDRGCIGRKYKVRFGYNGKGYFGEHLLGLAITGGRKVYVVEAPKTALILTCAYPQNVYLATQGSGKLWDVDPSWILLPDNDSAGRAWVDKYPKQCSDWVGYYRGLGMSVDEGDDVGDLILKCK